MPRSASRSLGTAVVCALALAETTCGSPAAPKPLETFTIEGVVRSGADQLPIDAAAIQVTGSGPYGQSSERTTTTDATGSYRVDGLRGYVTVTTRKFGFRKSISNTQLSADAVLDVTMIKAPPYLPEGGDLILDQTFSGTLTPDDPRCDPQWDLRSPCRNYGFVSTKPREYSFDVSFSGCGEMELHVFNTTGQRVAYTSASHRLSQAVILQPGDYRVRLMAYYSCELFEITVR
jgi:hypothetical protein